MSTHPEKILVVPQSAVEDFGIGDGLITENDFDSAAGLDLFDLLLAESGEFRVRDECEGDPAWRQIIPYVVLHRYDPPPVGRILVYSRGKSGGERRLDSKLSLGVGGHVEIGDGEASPLWALDVATRRELEEEIGVDAGHWSPTPIGLINDRSDAVGRDHLGVVFGVSTAVGLERSMLVDPAYMTVADVIAARGRFERWSRLLIDHWFGVAGQGRSSDDGQ